MLVGLGKQGLCCTCKYTSATLSQTLVIVCAPLFLVCRYVVHERCANRAPPNCISTYAKARKADTTMLHHWIEGNCPGRYGKRIELDSHSLFSFYSRCDRCKKSIKTYNGITGRHCRWCQTTLHNKCAAHLKPECTLGPNRDHIIPPSCICPAVLVGTESAGERTDVAICTSVQERPKAARSGNGIKREESCVEGSIHSFQINPLQNTHPLLVFINPKSGGKQGERYWKSIPR